jgi:hypothetical protein
MSVSFEFENNEKTKSSINHCFLSLEEKKLTKRKQSVCFPVTNSTEQKKGVSN